MLLVWAFVGFFQFFCWAETPPSINLNSSFVPEEIAIPPQLSKRTAKQIHLVFSSLEKQNQEKTANLWRLKYHKALLLKNKDKDSFCKIMQELSESPAFPLKDLAKIQSYKLCPFPFELSFEPHLFPEWLRLSLASALYKRRKHFEQPQLTLKALTYLSQKSPYKELRVSYLKHAIALAKEQDKEGSEVQKLRLFLYKESPSLKPRPGVEDYVSVAEDFREKRNFKKALYFYTRVLNSPQTPFEEKNLSFKGLDRIYKAKRDYKKRISNSRQWSEWLIKEGTEQSLKQYQESRLNLARQEWNRDKNQKAIQIINDLLKADVPPSPSALFLRGLIQEQEGEWELCLKDWDKALSLLSRKRSSSELLDKILWKKAWLFRRQKDYKKSLVNLSLLKKKTENPYTKYKALFWEGKTLQDLGLSSRAKRSFRSLIKEDFFGFYGLLARRALNERLVFQETKWDSKKFSFLGSKDDILIHWLFLFNESSLLSQFLDQKNYYFLSQKRKTEKEWLKMIWLWKKAKRHLQIFQSLEQMSHRVRSSFLKNHIQLLFPLDFLEEVEIASKKWKVPKPLIFAIIRQESAFNVRARSPADAFGLMQIIPSTGRQTARRHKIPYKNFRELYKPSKNILLGTAYLKRLLRQYEGSFLMAVSAYNAGNIPLNKWKEEMKALPPLEFIESMPYEETRTYARLLIRNYVFYHNILKAGEEEGPWFPDSLLKKTSD